MKAIAVTPKQTNSIRLVEMDTPKVSDVPDGLGVLVEVLRVGACGTDREINNGEYGVAPDGFDFLVLGHENFGRVAEVGANVRDLKPGDYVVATVRRPRGSSIYDKIGEQDFTTDNVYFERGISRLHGYMAEFYAESTNFLVKIPPAIAEIAVLLEPLSIVEKGLKQASDIQERLKIWQPKTAAVLGVGNVGLLTVMALRMRGYEVHGFGLDKPEAVENFKKALEGDEADPDYWFNVGLMLWKQGQFEAAKQKFVAVLERNPKDQEASDMFGRTTRQEGAKPNTPAPRERVKSTFEETMFLQLKAALKQK